MTPTKRHRVSPFLDPGPNTKANSLAILQLSRDNLLPVYLQPATGEHDGYAEGAVVNTRYGSFPHSTMLNVPWGSQIRASKVDTGSRGRKRKRETGDDVCREATAASEEKDAEDSAAPIKQAVADASGFIHVLPPTPELWTSSLPHRTQVVYTPDYSYILHRIRARPGSTVIEAGAGSGSFTHASVRAVYNGYPNGEQRKGKVFSFEFHEQRYHKMKKELADHGLEGLVQLTHRDVYNGGFLVDGQSPGADAVFLDLPAPWEALPHLSRRRPTTPADANEATSTNNNEPAWISPLNPNKSVHLCTFSPCIEQVTRTVSAMRRLGWVDIDMVEIANRKLHTSRERVGLHLNFDRGVNNSPRDVEEALARLADIEARFREHATTRRRGADADGDEDMDSADEGDALPQQAAAATAATAASGKMTNGHTVPLVNSNSGDGEANEETTPPSGSAPTTITTTAPWMEGRLITRGEPEIKTHTSYLVFAVLPREWTAADEAAAAAQYPVVVSQEEEQKVIGAMDKAARKRERREMLLKQQGGGSRKARRKERDEKLAETSG